MAQGRIRQNIRNILNDRELKTIFNEEMGVLRKSCKSHIGGGG